MDAGTLLIVALCLNGTVAVVWAVIGWVLKVMPHAVLHWAFSNMAIGTGVLLLYHRGTWPDTLAFFGSDIALLSGFFALCRGVQCFAGLRRTDLEYAIVLGVGAVVLAYYRGCRAGRGIRCPSLRPARWVPMPCCAQAAKPTGTCDVSSSVCPV
ncbi:hypothetical protein M8A51_07175 [Schlegelella sp. S2-27]|uniref:Uncharacterized protein n=1 Tax=Caldimonas mangrovi TaxID=2944811 RepID=A0ABT0YKP6_9BURK|nr:hypothetical protein [Caldimonas mangrovi]MCM5679311.1 hypothetical protein [Caldimonas mangrovi]